MVYGPNTSTKAKGSLNPPRSVEAVLERKIIYQKVGKGQNTYLFGDMDGFLRSKINKEKTSHSSIAAAYHCMPCELNYIQCPSPIHFIFFLTWQQSTAPQQHPNKFNHSRRIRTLNPPAHSYFHAPNNQSSKRGVPRQGPSKRKTGEIISSHRVQSGTMAWGGREASYEQSS